MEMMMVECKLCGNLFETIKCPNHARHCDECRKAIAGTARREAYRKNNRIRDIKHSQAKIDALAAMAREYGVSYGQFVALRASGYFMGLTPGAKRIKNIYHEEWQKELLSIAGRSKSHGI